MTEIPTKLKLAVAIRECGAEHEDLAERAASGEFDDFESPHATPITFLVRELEQAKLFKLADRVKEGDFDCTEAEADAWMDSADGKATFGLLFNLARDKRV